MPGGGGGGRSGAAVGRMNILNDTKELIFCGVQILNC